MIHDFSKYGEDHYNESLSVDEINLPHLCNVYIKFHIV